MKKGFSLIDMLVVVAVVGIGAALVIPIVTRPRESVRANCPNNLKQIGVAMLQYNQDFDEHLPRVASAKIPTAKTAYGWADALHPYARTLQIFQCFAEKTRGGNVATATGYTDDWFNSNLSGLDWGKSNTGQATITLAFGDGNDGKDLTDARYNLNKLPAAWINDEKSPLKRHLGGANYAFLDGHVKWLHPDQVTNEPPANGKATFEVK